MSPYFTDPDYNPHYVYIIAPDQDRPEYCKVGISADPEGRLRGVQTGSPIRLKLYYVFKFASREQAAWIERYVHDGCEDDGRRLAGEWVKGDPLDAMQWIDSALSSYVERVMLPGTCYGQNPAVRKVYEAMQEFCGLEPLMEEIFGMKAFQRDLARLRNEPGYAVRVAARRAEIAARLASEQETVQ